MRVVLYARVSSEKQAEKDLSIPAQLKALRKYALQRNWEIVSEYIDEAESARSVNRPAFQEMITAAKKKDKPFDVILVWKLSRFARNREDSIIYKSLLRKRGISLISINEQIDDSAAGKLLEGMIEVIDEFYSANLAQDTMRGMKENANRGFSNGGIVPFGYRKVKVSAGNSQKTKLEPDDIEAPIVRYAFKMAKAAKRLPRYSIQMGTVHAPGNFSAQRSSTTGYEIRSTLGNWCGTEPIKPMKDHAANPGKRLS